MVPQGRPCLQQRRQGGKTCLRAHGYAPGDLGLELGASEGLLGGECGGHLHCVNATRQLLCLCKLEDRLQSQILEAYPLSKFAVCHGTPFVGCLDACHMTKTSVIAQHAQVDPLRRRSNGCLAEFYFGVLLYFFMFIC